MVCQGYQINYKMGRGNLSKPLHLELLLNPGRLLISRVLGNKSEGNADPSVFGIRCDTLHVNELREIYAKSFGSL